MRRKLQTLTAALAIVPLAIAVFAAGSNAYSSGAPRLNSGSDDASVGPIGEGGAIILPLGVGSAAAIGAAVLFVMVRRRRAATGESGIDAPGLRSEPISPLVPGSAPTGEEHIPRWRRPSVTAARFESHSTVAIRAAIPTTEPPPARVPLVFAEPIDAGAELLFVRYDGVPLLDRPEDALGRPLSELNTGDEVAVVAGDDLWAHVTTPTRLAGWVARMALTPVALESSEAEPPPATPIEPEPQAESGEVQLESLLEAIAAERRARRDGAPAESELAIPGAQAEGAPPVARKRARRTAIDSTGTHTKSAPKPRRRSRSSTDSG